MRDNKEQFYRLVVGGVGIYEAVDRDCPKDDSRRKNKPDGTWLPRKGQDYPGAISFWSEYGLKRYFSSGLMGWHVTVVRGTVEVIIIKRPLEILYEDEYQIICKTEVIKEKTQVPLKELGLVKSK